MNPDILQQEISYRTSRSSGPGGQNVNKVESKVDLLFDVMKSNALDETEKEWVMTRLENKINKDGLLIVTNQTTRSQLGNKENAYAEFLFLMEEATKPPKKRKKVKPFTAKREERLREKRELSDKKALRQKVTLNSK